MEDFQQMYRKIQNWIQTKVPMEGDGGHMRPQSKNPKNTGEY